MFCDFSNHLAPRTVRRDYVWQFSSSRLMLSKPWGHPFFSFFMTEVISSSDDSSIKVMSAAVQWFPLHYQAWKTVCDRFLPRDAILAQYVLQPGSVRGCRSCCQHNLRYTIAKGTDFSWWQTSWWNCNDVTPVWTLNTHGDFWPISLHPRNSTCTTVT